MFTLRDSILIHAPIERCFALSTSIAIVQRELRMNPVAGRTSGLVTGGDTVRWEGLQFGFRNFHVSIIVPDLEPAALLSGPYDRRTIQELRARPSLH